MEEVIAIHAAKSRLSELVKRAASGQPVYIGAYGHAQVKLVAVGDEAAAPAKRFGVLAGRLELPDDLEAPLPADVLSLFEGGAEP